MHNLLKFKLFLFLLYIFDLCTQRSNASKLVGIVKLPESVYQLPACDALLADMLIRCVTRGAFENNFR